VMGTHGRKGIDHFLFAARPERVVRTAVCPVLTVRPLRILGFPTLHVHGRFTKGSDRAALLLYCAPLAPESSDLS